MSEPSELELLFALALRTYSIPQPEVEYRFLPERRYRFDFAWASLKLAVEIQGGTWRKGGHSSGKGIKRDIEKHNLAVYAGWKLLYFDGDMVRDGSAARDAALFVQELTVTRED